MIPRHRISRVAIVTLMSAMIVVNGCSFSSFVSTALADLPVLVQIATNILSIVSVAQGNGSLDAATSNQIASVASQVKADLTLVQTLVNQYKTADSTAKPGIAGQIDAALSTIASNLNAILSAAHIANPALQSTITGAVTIALATVLAIQSLVPQPTTVVTAKGTRAVRTPIKPADPKTIKRQVNAIFQANGYGQFAIQ